jgi:nucleotidyltransferase/DNA polymerase involved in DNA repair
MDVCIENVFPAVAMPFNPFQRDPREDGDHEDERRKPDTSDSKVVPYIGPVPVDALFASVKAGTDDPEVLDELIEYLSERLGIALREAGQRARTIGVQIRYVDQFSARQTLRLTRPSNDECELLAEARELFASICKRRVPVQVLSLSATNLEPCSRREELHGGEFALAGAQHAAPLRVAARVGLR